ncbi:MAG: DUF6375 family protein [Dehalococcoidia bacterium]|nr:DUF6375 family protein [Dehalococcoidia bacterium]
MKVWFGCSSEHSSNLVMIGRFKELGDAAEAKEIITLLTEQVRADEQAGLTKVGDGADRYTDGMLKLLEQAKIYSIGPGELEQFVYDITIVVKTNELVLRTDEIDVSAFLKVLLDKGARVEVYSAHNYPGTEDQRG